MNETTRRTGFLVALLLAPMACGPSSREAPVGLAPPDRSPRAVAIVADGFSQPGPDGNSAKLESGQMSGDLAGADMETTHCVGEPMMHRDGTVWMTAPTSASATVTLTAATITVGAIRFHPLTGPTGADVCTMPMRQDAMGAMGGMDAADMETCTARQSMMAADYDTWITGPLTLDLTAATPPAALTGVALVAGTTYMTALFPVTGATTPSLFVAGTWADDATSFAFEIAVDLPHPLHLRLYDGAYAGALTAQVPLAAALAVVDLSQCLDLAVQRGDTYVFSDSRICSLGAALMHLDMPRPTSSDHTHRVSEH